MEPLIADLSLIRDYRREDAHDQVPAKVTHYQKNGKTLRYVSVNHVSGVDNAVCATIADAIRSDPPQLVIVEGFETGKGYSPAEYIAYFPKAGGTYVSEQLFAAHLAHQKDIPFLGGEAAPSAILHALNAEGYSAQDYMGIYLLALIPALRAEAEGRGDPLDESRFAENADVFFQQCPDFAGIPTAARLDYAQFKRWYERHRENDAHFLTVEHEDFNPYNTADATYFQKLFHVMTRAREAHLDRIIVEALNAYDHVMVVYGSGHHLRSEKLFQSLFGQAGEVTQLVPGTTADEQDAYYRKFLSASRWQKTVSHQTNQSTRNFPDLITSRIFILRHIRR